MSTVVDTPGGTRRPAAARDLDIGAAVRARRQRLGLSVRALAARAAVSPAYLSAIESSRSPSTGRAPVVSLAVAGRLADALGVDVTGLTAGTDPAREGGTHVLAQVATASAPGLLAALDARYGAGVDHWLHICDPRSPDPAPDARFTTRRLPFGSPPYAEPVLDPDALFEALDVVVAALAREGRGDRVGLVIADCSALMRYLHDPSAGVDLERSWHAGVTRIWQERLGHAPAVDVCVYAQDDLDALGLTIDQLGTALALVARHDRVLVLDGDRALEGAAAVRGILARTRPPGASTPSWEALVTAAAPTLAR